MNTDIKRFRTAGPRNLVVYYTAEMDGGGTWFGQEYVNCLLYTSDAADE